MQLCSTGKPEENDQWSRIKAEARSEHLLLLHCSMSRQIMQIQLLSRETAVTRRYGQLCGEFVQVAG